MKAQREIAHHPGDESHESLGELLGDLMTQSTALVKDEIGLMKAELRQEASTYRLPAVTIGVGVAFGLLSGIAFLTAGVIALSRYIGLVTSALVFGAGLAAVAMLLVTLGLRKFKRHVA